MAFKINESIIVIQAEATSPNRTNVVFWSHDRGTAKLRMKLVRKNGIPQSLPEGTTVPIRLMFRSATAEGGYGKHDYLATIEDRVNGIVSIVLEDNILGYVGIVEGSVYIDFPNDRSLDTAGRFTFDIKRSPIDDSTPELEDYYFNGFSQTIDKIEKILADGKQEIEQKITESETQIDAKLKNTNDKITKANQDVTTLNTNIDKANDRIDQTNQQISDLGKLKKMYSNSIDFGNYDYSGNPNLLSKLSYDLIENQNTSAGTLSKGENSFKYNKISAEVEGGVELYYKRRGIANWLPSNKTLVMTVKLRAGADYSPVDGKLILIRYRYVDSGTGKIVL
ncbi:TPA: BppU family phage baseplate upper protein, partial [Enterococcus faecium]